MRKSLVALLSLSLLAASPAAFAKRAKPGAAKSAKGPKAGKGAKGPRTAKAPKGAKVAKGAKAGKGKRGRGVAGLDRSHIPDGGPAPKLNLPVPQRFALSSGAKVLVVERHTLPMAAVAVIWPAGAAVDPADRSGLAGLTADLLDEGTAKHDSQSLALELEALGSNLASGSTWDSTGVSLTSLTRNLDHSLALLAEVVITPAFDNTEIERKRAERMTGISQRRDHAQALASDLYAGALYGDAHPYGHTMAGTESGLARINRSDVVGFFYDRLGPANATILVVGDVDGRTIKDRLEAAFTNWTRVGGGVAAAAPVAPTAMAPRWLLGDKPGAPQSEIRIGLAGPARRTPDFFPLLVANGVLGGDFSSRLNLNLREAHGYTYGAHSDFAFRRDGGPFYIATAAKTEVTGPAIEESFKELDAMRTHEAAAPELRLAKDQLERAVARRFETLGQIAGELGQIVIEGLPDDYLATFADNVEKVSAADVLRVAGTWMSPDQMSVVVVGDARTVWPQVWKLGPFQSVDANGKPTHNTATPAAATPAAATTPPPASK